MKKIIKYVVVDILQNRIVLLYTLFLFVASFSIFSIEDNASKGLLSLLNVILLVVPLVSIVFATIYIYNSAEFIEFLVSQPLLRRWIWLSIFIGLAGSLVIAFLIGIGIPILIFQFNAVGLMMLGVGILVTISFVAIAMLAAVYTQDKAKGIGFSILLWLYFSVLFDGLVLFLLFQFSDYPIEHSMIIVSAFNPIDLARILILLHLDVSAMMGYTGAIFKEYFGTILGVLLSFGILLLWGGIPVLFSLLKFNRKDL